MDKEIFLLLLGKEFYIENKSIIHEDLFTEELRPIYRSLVEAHDKYKKDLSLLDLWELHSANNPTMTNAKREALKLLFSRLKHTKETVNPEIAADIIQDKYQQYYLERIADLAVRVSEGEQPESNRRKLCEMFDKLNGELVPSFEDKFTPKDMDLLFEEVSRTYKWKWNFEDINVIGVDMGDGIHGIVGARPDAGKTGMWLHSVFGPDGLLDQGAHVAVFANEEATSRTMLRGICCYTGISFDELAEENEDGTLTEAALAKRKEAKEKFAAIKDRVEIIQDIDIDIHGIDSYCAKFNPDVVILDQLDNLPASGFARGDEKFDWLYREARKIAIRRQCCVISITQASAEAQGELYYGYDALAGSKTSKAAAADWIICIGMEDPAKYQGQDSGIRVMNFPKNKGVRNKKGTVTYRLDSELSRMTG